MPESSHSQSPARTGSSKSNFPFQSPPALGTTSETVLSPERRPGTNEGSSYNGPRPDQQLQGLLFPDFSRLEAGELPTSPAGVKLAHFEIVDRIGAGGMGSVFLALDTHLQRYVALKILSPAQAREHNSIQRFLNEARAAARLDYDGIARVHFYGEDQGFHFIAFEYVTGTNLRDMIQARGQLSTSDAVNYTLQVAHALKYTSAAGVVHRDVKPSNIIVNPAGRVKLVDLGLARKESSESIDDLTVAGTTLGTFDYISPEQAQDPRNVDVRSDIYSLGCTLYHLLTGEPPYPQGTLAQKLLEHQQSYAPDPALKNRRVPPELSAIVKRMMASDPRKRYQVPIHLIRDLLHVAERLGLRGTTTEGLVWRSSERTRSRQLLLNYVSWLVAGAILVMTAFAVDRYFPGDDPNSLTQDLNRNSEVVPANDAPVAPADSSDDRIPVSTPIEPVMVSESQSGEIPGALPLNADKPDAKIFRNPEDPDQMFGPPFPESTDVVGTTNGPRRTSETSPRIAETNSAVPTDFPTTTTTGSNNVAGSNDSATAPGPVAERKIIHLMHPGIAQPIPFDTLEGACAEAKDGSVIELSYNGPRPGDPEKPITINRRIRIRAATGFQPEVRFASRDDAEESDLPMISLQGGALEISNVALTLAVNDPPASGNRTSWSLFSLRGAEQLQLQNVIATVTNPRGYSAVLIELDSSSSVNLDNMKMKTASGSTTGSTALFDISIFESILRGECGGVLVKSTRPGNLAITRSILAVQGAFCEVQGSSDMPPEAEFLNVNLDHISCLVQGALFRVDTGEIREVVPLNVSSRNSYFVQRPTDVAPLIGMTGNKDAVDFRDNLLWRGEHNFYDGFEIFWTINDSSGSSDIDDLYFEGWQAHWSVTFGGAEDESNPGELAWNPDWTRKGIALLEPDDFEDLDPLDEAFRATDGTPIGAPLDAVGFSLLP